MSAGHSWRVVRRVRNGPAGVLPGPMRRRLQDAVGGAARLRVIVLLAAVLALTSADQATVGAMAGQLRGSLNIDNIDIGLLVTTSGAVGVLTALPFGWLADHVNRVRLLTGSVVLWSTAMLASSAAQSFGSLLVSRLALGAVIASAGPIVASLIGDLFAPAERGRIYGFILTGELFGAGVGLLVSGDVAALWTWRASFGLLAVLGLALAYALGRLLPEPRRGQRSGLPAPARRPAGGSPVASTNQARELAPDLAEEILRTNVAPRTGRLTDPLPQRETLWWAVRSVLSIRTNVALIAASSLGYFFYGGMQTFAVMFAKARFGLNQAEASLFLLVIGAGAVAGILLAGRLSDALIVRHHVSARPAVAAACYLLAVAMFLPALLTTSLLVAVPLLFLAVIGVGGANPALDAARLDVVPASLWGRAESVRTVVRTVLQSGAPLVFGWLSTQLGGTSGAGVGDPDSTQPHGALGLDRTFLIMLVPLLAAGALVAFAARHTYPGDVATALATDTPRRNQDPAAPAVISIVADDRNRRSDTPWKAAGG